MSDAPDTTPDDGLDLTAAEYVLGLLQGEAHAATEAREDADPAFAAEADLWRERFYPLLERLDGVPPSPEVWARIKRHIEEDHARPGVHDPLLYGA